MTDPTFDIVSDNTGQPDWSAIFVGDCILEGDFDRPPLTDGVIEEITCAEMSVFNLEAPIAGTTKIPKQGPTKETLPETPAVLREAGFNAATLANNHIMDYGDLGLFKSVESCESENIATFGVGNNHDDALSPLTTTINNTTIALFGVCEREFSLAGKTSPGAAWVSHPNTESQIRHASKKNGIVIVCSHGGTEHVPVPPPNRQEQLRAFVDEGADVVIGHHPHVAQGWEVYNGSPIFYSLGNFLYWKPARPSTEWSLGVRLNFQESDLTSVQGILFEINDTQVAKMGGKRNSQDHIAHLERISELVEKGYAGYWQEIAIRKFESWYNGRIKYYGLPRPIAILLYPLWFLDEVTRGKVTQKDQSEERMLDILNYIQNESHNDIMISALRMKLGIDTDFRSPSICDEVEQLLEWTDERDEEDFLERWIRRSKITWQRIQN